MVGKPIQKIQIRTIQSLACTNQYEIINTKKNITHLFYTTPLETHKNLKNGTK